MKKIKIASAEERRKKRVRTKINAFGRRKLTVFKSNKHIYGQIVDLAQGKTLVGFSDQALIKKDKKLSSLPKKEVAFEVGKKLAEMAKILKITKIIFDRGQYRYHGRVKALAEGARQGGLKF